MMADNKDKAQRGKQDAPGQGGGKNRQGGDAGSGSGAAAAADSGSGQYTGGAGAGESRQSGFLHSSPEANVFPAGSAQSDNRGRAGGDSAAGTPDEGKLGGTGGTSAPGTTGNDPDR
jgi:hypothetical protein